MAISALPEALPPLRQSECKRIPAANLPEVLNQANVDVLRKRKQSPMLRPSQMTAQAAESVAIQGLAFLASDPDRIGDFLAESGIGPEKIREAARESRFLAGVLDYLAGNERLLVAFAQSLTIDPGQIERARQSLGHRP